MSGRAARIVLRGAQLFNLGNVDAMVDQLWHPDAVYTDHRPIGWETMGREQVRELNRSAFTVVRDIRRDTTVVADSGDVVVCLVRFSGHATEGGGEVDLEYAEVTVVSAELIVRRDIYADAADALAAVASSVPGPQGDAG